MRNIIGIKLAGPVLLAVGLVVAASTNAQMGSGMMSGGKDDPGMMQMSGIMHDMAEHMTSISGQMSHGNLSKAEQKRMSETMREMSTMMDGMSGMMGKGMVMDKKQSRHMGNMRKQMDQMMK